MPSVIHKLKLPFCSLNSKALQIEIKHPFIPNGSGKMVPWMTIFFYKQVVFDFHDYFREDIAENENFLRVGMAHMLNIRANIPSLFLLFSMINHSHCLRLIQQRVDG